jgi:hypothetical protein
MANWADTSYVIVDKGARELYNIMRDLEQRLEPLHPNGWGNTWLGNLVIALGGDWERVHCRGEWDEMEWNEEAEELRFRTESAWSHPHEVMELVKEKFPGISIFFISEEPGMEIYVTNDSKGLYYPYRYFLAPYDGEWHYYEDGEEEKFLADISNCIGKEVKALADVRDAVIEYNEEHEDEPLDYGIYDVIDTIY